jgi:hypothetical protein
MKEGKDICFFIWMSNIILKGTKVGIVITTDIIGTTGWLPFAH